MRISVVIPALNEATTIAHTLASLRAERPHEIIVVDGGSDDDTPEQARAADLVLRGSRGRALQMNHGASHATGDVLLFLHADCTPQPGCLDAVRKTLSRRHVVAGCFRMRVAAPGWMYRLIDACATGRVRLSGIVYGDQGLFLRRDVFNSVNGFPSLRLMEDVYLSLRLRRLGTIAVAPSELVVSPRRWQRQGIVRQTVRNWTLVGLAAAGVHPDRLARFYPSVR